MEAVFRDCKNVCVCVCVCVDNRVFNNYVSTESFNIELHEKTLAFGNLERIGRKWSWPTFL
jgi:hypothetical protein